MNKETTRKRYIAKRNELSPEQIQLDSKLIAENFIASDLWKNVKCIHIFISIPGKAEVDTSFLIDCFFKKYPEIKICTSVVVGNDLVHTHINETTTYLPNKWNIPEPVERTEVDERNIDLVFVPLLAFDSNGNRVGYGKGFYDRFFQRCRPDVIKVGLSLFEAAEALIETDAWDVPLNWAITPKQVYTF